MTSEQFTRILGPERWKQIQQRGGKNLQDLLAKAELPIFLVDFDDVADFCVGLEKLCQLQPGQDLSRLETRTFRLPTHYEWQYACRARQKAEDGDAWPHFYAWPENAQVLDRITQQKCLEEWQELGRQEAFVGGQQQVADILRLRQDKASNKKPLQIFTAFMEAAIGVKRNYEEPGDPLPLGKPRASRPNAWNLYDLHNNVREWTLVASTQDEAKDLWQKLTGDPQTRRPLARQGLFFWAGGSFIDTATGKNGWMKFTIWGGFIGKVDNADVGLIPDTGNIVPISLQDVKDSDLLTDQAPGFRIVMQRRLRNDWRQLVRQDAALADPIAPGTLDAFAGHGRVVKELLPPDQQAEAQNYLDYYAALAALRLGKKDVCRETFQGDKLAPVKQADPYFDALAKLIALDTQ